MAHCFEFYGATNFVESMNFGFKDLNRRFLFFCIFFRLFQLTAFLKGCRTIKEFQNAKENYD